MPGVNYQRSAALSRLFLSAAPVPVWSAFLLSDQSNFNQNSIDLTAAWRERGAAFLFASQAPANPDRAWLDALWQAILKKTPQFFWNALVFLREPEAPRPENIWVIPITQPSTLQFRVYEETLLPIGNGFAELRFRKDARVSIHFQGDDSEIRLEWPNFHPMETFIQGQPITVQTSRTVALPLTGPGCGSFRYDLHLKHNEQLAAYDLGLKYFYDDDKEIHFPVLYPGAENMGVFFHAAIDPLQLLNPGRTFFGFTGEMRRMTTLGQIEEAVFDTPFRTLKGYAIRLLPKKDSARLVFSRRRDALPGDPYYFVPAGDFSVEIIPRKGKLGLVNGHAKWLTGYTGTETLLFPYASGKLVLRFHPHRPAYAPQFPAPAASHTNRLVMDDPLTERCLTAWASLVHSDGLPVRHVAQPDGGPLYKPDAEDVGTPVFDYIDTTIPLPLDPGFCLPMAPHAAALVSPLEEAFENQILSPARKWQMDQVRPPAAPIAELVQTTSPQGALVKLQPEGNNWTEILLGQDENAAQLRFDNPPQTLQMAFQTNQQFLVVTNAEQLGAFQNQLTIAGWPFTFNTGQNQRLGDYNNVLIFKFCNESLLERIHNPALWTQPRDFNGAKNANPSDLELQLISRWLQDYINDAIVNQKDNPYFQDFIRIVQNPRWNGVLALKTDIGLDGLPAELQGLVGGIDASRFNAHHVGMEINQVQNTGAGELSFKEKSSFFGLVYYQDANYQKLMQGAQGARPSSFAPETFDFRVLTLFAQFKNSAIERFSSKIRVTLRELFQERVQKDAADYIDLDGVHEKKNGRDTYTFLSKDPVQFPVDSALYQDIEIDRAAFITHPRAEGSREVRSYFSFTGNLLFTIPQTGFDFLSFGRTEGLNEANPGLAFSNLQLDFSFSLDTPALREFAMQYPRVRFDLANSPARGGSLLHQMPLELKNFQFGGKNTPPAKLGYLPVELAGLETAPISGDWYGLECALHMGSAGGLSNIGNLVAPVLLAWGPGSKPGRPSLFMGLKLPGGNADAKMLSIQGLLKLSIDNLQLLSTPQGFILKLNDISLKFFGLAKIPPGGATSFYLFGNPEGASKELGWYAAYNKDV